MVMNVIPNKSKGRFRLNFLSRGLLKDSPGMLLYSDSDIWRCDRVKIRAAFMFEYNIKKLYEDTIEKIGKEKTDELWYRSGKDTAFRYLSKHRNLKNTKITKKLFFAEIKKFSDSFIGMNFLDEIRIEFKRGIFIFDFNEKYSKRYFMFSYLSGIISGAISCLTNKNTEAKFFPSDSKFKERIVADVAFDRRYEPDKELIKKFFLYSTDFLENKNISSGLYTFSDFIRFKIINICDNGGVFMKDEELFLYEAGVPSIFFKNYESIGADNVFRDSIIKSSEYICSRILRECKTNCEKVKLIRNTLSAMGLGEAYFKLDSGIVTTTFLKKIFVLENPSFVHLFVNGFLNHLHEKKAEMFFESQNIFKYKI